jgi:hypothetical protein
MFAEALEGNYGRKEEKRKMRYCIAAISRAFSAYLSNFTVKLL